MQHKSRHGRGVNKLAMGNQGCMLIKVLHIYFNNKINQLAILFILAWL